MGGCCAPAFGPRGPDQPGGRAPTTPAPPGSLPHSVARHAHGHACRSDPDATAKAPTPRRFPTETSHACGGSRPAPNPEPPERASREDSRPPLGSGVVAICLREHLGELASGP